MTASRPALFLDRDGVLNENAPDYVRRPADLHLFPAALAALARWQTPAYAVVVVTNQSGIGRGLFDQATAAAINDRLVRAAQAVGARIDAVYMCPHTPAARCDCRKPAPGMLWQAARELNLDLDRSIMIGDAITDVQAGRAAGVGRLALVRTGRGAKQQRLAAENGLADVPVYADLAAALAALTPIASRPDEAAPSVA